MTSPQELLQEVMLRTGTSQSGLARTSGVRQPSVSQLLSGRIGFTDGQLDRLLSCMGFRLEIERRAVEPDLTRAERRSWMLHCRLAAHLTKEVLQEWNALILANLHRLSRGVQGETHVRSVERWSSLVDTDDVVGLHRSMTGLDRSSIEMREVSPFSGLLPDEERLEVLRELSRSR